ncbi:transcriptional coactivator p15 (pc4), putative [Entamoeba histolytica HM-1:IMSS-B]|uniref:Transcriptional coactivator, putative n=5 Tax=Entamoeba histolytica TaxID=5759 RepID=C4M1H2_ENTH1|nr:transcriptional coactivator, putative [Entamoeba histolytica HM-1:IMSS]EMD43378.1 transcriptional coactivator p15 (PC4) protein, putative [Entamoeba histolytica KU27]EMH75633.1 transcriptional coactivator p15 (pc4), putative [Entamoeba histolytica HM-1:IMSS-B]ENY61174.1 transcriptional coactivator p15 (pc4) protein, putative [Entamoeba histolytica HM-1:IMSS-A]GAT95058.1 transcriptional coactivator putative [Entamoeba histolytica]EAL48492.1 transcriptional coactivator, putative [Entamoeba hi|eukprot:XP_653878.1 transcriptional coactivator, putative [Entamoeba histolytica HM-1:IMSS]
MSDKKPKHKSQDEEKEVEKTDKKKAKKEETEEESEEKKVIHKDKKGIKKKAKKEQEDSSSEESEEEKVSKKKAKKEKKEELKLPFDGDKYVQLGERKYVRLNQFRGTKYIDVREFYERDGELKPGQKGISLKDYEFEELVNNIDKIKKWIK